MRRSHRNPLGPTIFQRKIGTTGFEPANQAGLTEHLSRNTTKQKCADRIAILLARPFFLSYLPPFRISALHIGEISVLQYSSQTNCPDSQQSSSAATFKQTTNPRQVGSGLHDHRCSDIFFAQPNQSCLIVQNTSPPDYFSRRIQSACFVGLISQVYSYRVCVFFCFFIRA